LLLICASNSRHNCRSFDAEIFYSLSEAVEKPQKQNASIEAIVRFMKSPRDPKLNFERVVGRPGYFSFRVDYQTRILLRSTEADRKYEAVAVGNHDLVYESYFKG
jgi:hypothetical protein